MRKIPEDMVSGTIHQTNTCGNLTVIQYNNSLSVLVKFESTGYSVIKESGDIRKGSVNDPLFPKVFGKGFVGVGRYSPKDNVAYSTWWNMLKRALCPKFKEKHPTYKSCTIDTEWLNFQNFCGWFYDNYFEGASLDKDIKVIGNKMYSKDTCLFVTKEDNSLQVSGSRDKRYYLVSPKGVIYEFSNQRAFAREHELSQSGVNNLINNKQKTHKGWTVPERRYIP